MRLSLALLLIVFLQSPGNEGKHQAKPEQASRQTNAQTQNKAPVTPGFEEIPRSITQQKTQAQQPNRASERQPFMTHAEWIMSGLTAVYVLLSGLYVVYSHKTLRELQRQIGLIEKQNTATETQLKISEKSAEAAMLSAKSMISAERSWLIITTGPTGIDPLNFDIHATNHGNSPAEILWVFCDQVILDFGIQLPDEPEYGATNIIFAHRQWIPSGASFKVQDLSVVPAQPDDPNEIAAIRAGKKWLWT
jgi:hypothetical protein